MSRQPTVAPRSTAFGFYSGRRGLLIVAIAFTSRWHGTGLAVSQCLARQSTSRSSKGTANGLRVPFARKILINSIRLAEAKSKPKRMSRHQVQPIGASTTTRRGPEPSDTRPDCGNERDKTR